MNCYERNGRLFVDIDENTHLEFDKEGLKDKIENIPTAYMSSEERKDLEEYIKNRQECPL